MKNYILTYMTAFIVVLSLPSAAKADCDWPMVKPMPNGDYEYSPALHLCVGKLVQDSPVKTAQINDLQAAIQLKDLALTYSDSRAALWQKTAYDSQDRLSKIGSDQNRNYWVMFGLGALTMLGSAYMASHLIRN